ncbi:MAG: glycosyltransferase [Nitrospinota bacterium]
MTHSANLFLTYLFSTAFCVFWILTLLKNIRILIALPLFEDKRPAAPAAWPKLSVVVTARNEAAAIQPAIDSLLNQDYANLQIILVNDRSTDHTGEIVESISRKDPRVTALHITHLPENWLGKVHALYRGTKLVTGEWVLYTDADVCFQKDAIKKGVAFALCQNFDHFTLIPRVVSRSFLFDVLLKTFGAFLLQAVHSLNFCGIGAFNLVRKSALDKTEGFRWLRMEVADDMGLGLLLYRSGAKAGYALSIRDVHLTWYSSVRSMVRGLEKNMFSIVKYRLSKFVLLFSLLWAVALGPLYLLLFPPHPIFFYAAVIGYFLFLTNAVIGKIRFAEKILPSLCVQGGLILLSLILLRAAFLCTRRGGIFWRETFYSVRDLIAGQRLL